MDCLLITNERQKTFTKQIQSWALLNQKQRLLSLNFKIQVKDKVTELIEQQVTDEQEEIEIQSHRSAEEDTVFKIEHPLYHLLVLSWSVVCHGQTTILYRLHYQVAVTLLISECHVIYSILGLICISKKNVNKDNKLRATSQNLREKFFFE